MTVKQFFDKYNGKGIDWDNYYGYQCVDLYRQYCHEVLNAPQSPGVGGANELWSTYLKDHFTAIKNDPNAIPQLGDVIIWNKLAGGGYGHVGVFSSGDVNSFTSFDQNWPVGSLCHYQPHNYTNVTGWLRPKAFAGKQPTDTNKQKLIDAGLITRPDRPYSDDELNYLLNNHVGNVEAGRSTLTGDSYAREYWLNVWGVPKTVEKVVEKEVIKEVFVKPAFKNRVSNSLYSLALAFEGK